MNEFLTPVITVIVILGLLFWGAFSLSKQQEKECVEKCEEFSLDFYKFEGSYGTECWCLENKMPRQIY